MRLFNNAPTLSYQLPGHSSRCSGDRCLSAEGELASCKHGVSQPSIIRYPIMSLAASYAVKFGWLRKVAERPEITYNTCWHCFVRVRTLHHNHVRHFGYPHTRIRFIKSARPGTCNGRSLLLLRCSCQATSIPGQPSGSPGLTSVMTSSRGTQERDEGAAPAMMPTT
jgi:hypothetical protein